MSGGAEPAGFPVPASLQELESAPYHLLPYPADFDDSDESARAASFGSLVRLLEAGNRTLASAGIGLFEEEEGEEGYDEWCDNENTARVSMGQLAHVEEWRVSIHQECQLGWLLSVCCCCRLVGTKRSEVLITV